MVTYWENQILFAFMCFWQDLDLRLKWPNDIYFGDKMKLGGVLITSTIMSNMVYTIIGEQYSLKRIGPLKTCFVEWVELEDIKMKT